MGSFSNQTTRLSEVSSVQKGNHCVYLLMIWQLYKNNLITDEIKIILKFCYLARNYSILHYSKKKVAIHISFFEWFFKNLLMTTTTYNIIYKI